MKDSNFYKLNHSISSITPKNKINLIGKLRLKNLISLGFSSEALPKLLVLMLVHLLLPLLFHTIRPYCCCIIIRLHHSCINSIQLTKPSWRNRIQAIPKWETRVKPKALNGIVVLRGCRVYKYYWIACVSETWCGFR